MTATNYLNQLNQKYLATHKAKEDFFWDTYMGISDDHDGSTLAQTQWTEFLSSAEQIAAIETQLAAIDKIQDPLEKESTLTGLNGWLATFRSHAIESEQSQKLKAELIKFEAELFEKKQNHVMTYVNETGDETEGSLPVLGSAVRSNGNEQVRLSAHQALLDLEQWLLANGFIELLKKRNQFAQSLGFKTFFDYSVVKTEQMTTKQLFTILDDFEARTRDNHQQSLANLAEQKGESALQAHNFTYSFAG
ncbi:peptidase M3, partial [Vibrio splendidus]